MMGRVGRSGELVVTPPGLSDAALLYYNSMGITRGIVCRGGASHAKLGRDLATEWTPPVLADRGWHALRGTECGGMPIF